MSTQSELILQNLLNRAVTQGAQELHLAVGQRPTIRYNGQLSPITDGPVLVEKSVYDIVKSTLSDEEIKALDSDKEISTVKEVSSLGRFKVMAYYQRGTVSITFRIIPSVAPPLLELNIPSSVVNALDEARGLLLVSGPFDSGRSTVCASMLRYVMETQDVRVMTLENPLEYILENRRGVVEQRQVGKDVKDIDSGIALVEKEDIEVLFLSDIPNGNIAKKAVDLALSDRLVIASMQSDSAIRTIESLSEMSGIKGDSHFLNNLSDALRAVLNLRLAVKQGSSGRLLAMEIMLSSTEMKLAIKEGDYRRMQNIIHTSRQHGMITLDQYLSDLVSSGEISKDVAMKMAHDPERFRDLIVK